MRKHRTIPRVYAAAVPLHAVNICDGPFRPADPLAQLKKPRQGRTQDGIEPRTVPDLYPGIADRRPIRIVVTSTVDVS